MSGTGTSHRGHEGQLLDAPDAPTVAALEAENVCLLAVAETAMAHLYTLAASVEACGHVCGRPGRCGVCAAVAYVEGRRDA